MRLLALLAILPAAAAVPAVAQNRFAISDASPPVARPGLSFRISEDFAPDGTRRQRRGIVAGIEVLPQTTIGVGFFNSVPKARGPGFESRIDSFAKRSRKAAVGMTFRF